MNIQIKKYHIILAIIFCVFVGCETKEEKAYKIALHSNDIAELQEFLDKYEEEASAEEINDIKDKIKNLENDEAEYKEIINTQDLSLRVSLERKYLNRSNPLHEKEIKQLYHADKSKEDAVRAESSRNIGRNIGRAIGAKLGQYALKNELQSYFKNNIFHTINQNGEIGIVFGPVGTNGTGIGYLYQQAQNPIKFSFTFLGNGQLGVMLPNGRDIFYIYKNGLNVDGTLFEKTYDPQTYQYFFR